MNPKIITKAAFARKTGRSKSAVSHYCRRGLPLTASGRVPLALALAWVKDSIGIYRTPIRPGDGRPKLLPAGLEFARTNFARASTAGRSGWPQSWVASCQPLSACNKCHDVGSCFAADRRTAFT
jgi:hypothetical protein